MLGYVLLDQDCSVPCCGSHYFYFGFLSGYEPFGVLLLYGAVRNSSLKMLVGFYSLLMARWLSGEVLWDFFFLEGKPFQVDTIFLEKAESLTSVSGSSFVAGVWLSPFG